MKDYFVILFTSIVLIAVMGCETPPHSTMGKRVVFPDTAASLPSEMTILFGGDYMQHSPQIYAAMRKQGGYDYTPTLKYMDSLWSRADIVALNFETTVGTGNYSGYPLFVSPMECMSALKTSGVDIIFTANNHCCDGGGRGLAQTIQCADSLGLMHLGTYRDSSEHEKNRVLYIEKNGINVALLNYTYGTNGLRIPKGCVVNLIDTVKIRDDLAFTAGADVKIVVLHWGWEYHREANHHQKELAKWLRKLGVDIVIGAHPHVVQPADLYVDEKGNVTGAVFYSLGNFISNQRDRFRDGGINVKLYIQKDITGKVFFGVESTPVWVRKYFDSDRYKYELLPSYMEGRVALSEWELMLFKRSIEDNELRLLMINE